MAEIITTEQFEEKVLQSDIPVIVDFYSQHCPPCKKYAPVFDQVAEEYAVSARFFKMEVNENFFLANYCGVSSFPTTIVFRDGELDFRIIGPRDHDTLVKELELSE